MGYLDGVNEEIAVQRAIDRRRVVIGEDKIFTDKGTVKSAQLALQTLAKKTGNAAFDPGEIDGKIGPHTQAAVTAFNTTYGWPADGDQITEGTFTAFQRPDVMDPPARASAVAHSTPPPPLPPTPKQVEQMVAPVVSAPAAAHAGDLSSALPSINSALQEALPALTRSPSVFQRSKPAVAPVPAAPAGGSSATKWIFVGIAGIAGLGVVWLLIDTVRGRRSARGGGGSAPRHTLVGYRRT